MALLLLTPATKKQIPAISSKIAIFTHRLDETSTQPLRTLGPVINENCLLVQLKVAKFNISGPDKTQCEALAISSDPSFPGPLNDLLFGNSNNIQLMLKELIARQMM